MNSRNASSLRIPARQGAACPVIWAMMFVLAALWLPHAAFGDTASGLVIVRGEWQQGFRPMLYVRAEGDGYSGSVMLESNGTQSNSIWILITDKATCSITLHGVTGHVTGSIQDQKTGTNALPDRIQIQQHYAGYPVALIKSERWLRVSCPGESWVQNFSISKIRPFDHESIARVTVELMLYKPNKDGKRAELVEFVPLELQLPPIQAGQGASPALPPASGSPVKPARTDQDRTAALADLPVPRAQWIPWAAWGTAAAALFVAGLLLRRRRRAARPEKSGG